MSINKSNKYIKEAIPIKKITPFDRDSNEPILLKILINTESVANEILNNEKGIIALLKMSHFPFLKIHFTPTPQAVIKKRMADYDVKACEYCFHEDGESFVYLKSNDFENIVCYYDKKEKERLLKKICLNSKVKIIDLIAGHDTYYDYFVVGKNDGIHYSKLKKSKDQCSEKTVELARILLVNLGYFYVNPKYSLNEGYYYLYRFKKVFKEFQPAWSIVCSSKGLSVSEELFNQLDSLSQRLEFICRASDKVSFYSLKLANNDTQDNTLYHLGYLVMLITGVFDDLAWVIKHLYNFELSRMQVVLRVSDKRKKFYSLLAEKNKELHDFLVSEHTQNLINLFYPIRDALQHRQFVKGMRYSDSEGVDCNVFALPEDTLLFVENVSKDTKDFGLVFNNKSIGDFCLFDSHVFSMKAVETASYIVNNTLSLINWDRVLSVLSEEKLANLKESLDKYKKGLEYFLGFGEEPPYF